MNLLGQRVMKCEHCEKEFLYFGVPQDEESYFCSPECSENHNKEVKENKE